MSLTATMSLSLPAAPEDNRFRLLLIEDDEAAARLLLSFLERTGFECHHATDAEAGIAAFNEAKPHLLLTEVSTENIDGNALCHWVREKSGVPVVIFGPADESTEVAAFKTGADDYLAHPLRPAVLMARVVAQLRRAYRYNAPPPKPDNPFGLAMEEDKPEHSIPSGWAECEMCGYVGPRGKFEKESFLGDIKIRCPNCKSTEHVIFSID